MNRRSVLGRRSALLWFASVTWLAAAGCTWKPIEWKNPFRPAAASNQIADADTGFTDVALLDPTPVSASAQPRIFRVDLSVLHVKVPYADTSLMETIWNHLREDGLNADTQLLLNRNGLRVGLGHVDDWLAIKAIFDGIEGSLVNQADPIRLPEWVPLDLELDLEPVSQTIFYLDRDGILSGATWPRSRKFLRIAHTIDRRHPDRIHLQMMPVVRQEMSGKRWVRTPIGVTQIPQYHGRQFSELAYGVELDPGQFLVLSPGRSADVAGLIGRVFLTEKLDGKRFDSYIFIRPVVHEAAPRE